MIEAAMPRILFEAAIDRAALVADRDRGQNIIQREVDQRCEQQAEKHGMIAENHANGKY